MVSVRILSVGAEQSKFVHETRESLKLKLTKLKHPIAGASEALATAV